MAVSDPGEIIISQPESTQSWLNKLSDEEKQRLYDAIRYDANQNIEHAAGVCTC